MIMNSYAQRNEQLLTCYLQKVNKNVNIVINKIVDNDITLFRKKSYS